MSSPRQVVLRSPALEASFLPELGARMHRLRAFGHDLLRTPDDPATHADDPFSWGAYAMAPWCNRAPAGRRTVAGRAVEFVPNFPDGTAIHGLLASRPWRVGDEGSFEVGWDGGSDTWPWAFVLRLKADVRGTTLALDYRLTNLADAAMPAGMGLHPWFRRPIELRVPAAAAYHANTGSRRRPEAVKGRLDLRSLTAPALGLDGTWTALRDPRIDLAWPDLGVRAALEMRSTALTLVAVASPEAIAAVAVEPQTHGPDPFRRLEAGEPDGPELLAPGSELHLGLRLTVGPAGNVMETEGVWSSP